MFKFSCDGCPARKTAVAYARCAEMGACWLGNGVHPVAEVVNQIGVDYADLIEPVTRIRITNGVEVEPSELSETGKLVMKHAEHLALTRQRYRLEEFGIENRRD